MHALMFAGWLACLSLAQVPHNQDQPPGPALSPQEALAKMSVPDGFTVELVASEPDIMNPVAMTIDERGRFWVTESFEYPRHEAGPGKDRIKILEDTDGDGRAEKVTIFAEGLNIPSGIAVGHGGVWVANSPDLLFLRDTDGDGKADKQDVVVTGFGRTDTHELPNSLLWGPDGWLYGLNGVFNHSHVKYSPSNPNFKENHPGWAFTCALFRVHPRTREFQIFCEGTSNPWGLTTNEEGSFFISACVIDHLWHLVQTGYYHRQGGAYPPHTWKIESIVKHKHQKAAYCGMTWFDSDAYPEQYRRKLYMGNIHGNCINSDKLQRNGSTYFGTGEPDFLSANDAWFMPVAQKVGPDGCLYVLDWYDRYHCYQDANRDPAGIDRLKGRLYRIRYKDSPRTPQFDLAKESDEQLFVRLGDPNIYYRETAQRILAERNTRAITQRLGGIALAANTPEVQRRHARFALLSCDLIGSKTDFLEARWANDFLKQPTPEDRVWGIRCLAEHVLVSFRNPRLGRGQLEESHFFELLSRGASDESPAVRLETMITVGLVGREYGMPLQHIYVAAYPQLVLEALGSEKNEDPLLARMAWQSLQPWLDHDPQQVVEYLGTPTMPFNSDTESTPLTWPSMADILPRIIDKLLSNPTTKEAVLSQFMEQFTSGPTANPELAAMLLRKVTARSQTGELSDELEQQLHAKWSGQLLRILKAGDRQPLYHAAVSLATTWEMKPGYEAALLVLGTEKFSNDERVAALESLAFAGQDELLRPVSRAFDNPTPETQEFRSRLLSGLARLDDPEVAAFILHYYSKLEPDLQPKAIELLTQRANWGLQLLAAIKTEKLTAAALNVNQVRKLLAFKNPELTQLVTATWGTLREERDPAREQVIRDMRQLIRSNPGDPLAGQKVFAKVCGQCHKIHGEGQDVGPDITLNGRNSYEQLLSNVFDPSLVIGAAYQARTVATTEGRVLTGLTVEDSPERITLKIQGGKLETIPRDQIEETRLSPLSMMPEGLEKQITQQEMIDLWAFLVLDKPPTDPSAKVLSGVR